MAGFYAHLQSVILGISSRLTLDSYATMLGYFRIRSTMADLADKDAAVSHAINLIRAKAGQKAQV